MAFEDFLERLRAKPEHVRRQIALRTSGAVTLVVFLGWATAFASSGTLALNDTGSTSSNLAEATQNTDLDVSRLLGAANAFQQDIEEATSIRVVETNASSTLDANTGVGEETVIPF